MRYAVRIDVDAAGLALCDDAVQWLFEDPGRVPKSSVTSLLRAPFGYQVTKYECDAVWFTTRADAVRACLLVDAGMHSDLVGHVRLSVVEVP